MIDRDRRKGMFDLMAREYDAVRPGYPAELFAELERRGVLWQGCAALEIGCGSGQATRHLADRGAQLVTLDPSANMLGIAEARFADHADVTFLQQTFEEFEGEEESLDLILAATAWHWVEPALGYSKVARLLKPGGSFVILANLHPAAIAEFFSRIQSVYQEVVPEWGSINRNATTEDVIRGSRGEIDASGYFTPADVLEYDWTEIYSRERFLRLLATYSDHRSLEPERFAALQDGIGRIIEEEYGGEVRRDYVTVAYLAGRLAGE